MQLFVRKYSSGAGLGQDSERVFGNHDTFMRDGCENIPNGGVYLCRGGDGDGVAMCRGGLCSDGDGAGAASGSE